MGQTHTYRYINVPAKPTVDLKITVRLQCRLSHDGSPWPLQSRDNIYRYTDGTITEIDVGTLSYSSYISEERATAWASVSSVTIEPWS